MESHTARHRVIQKSQLIRVSLLVLAIAIVGGGLLVWVVTGYLDALEELARSSPALAAQRVRLVLQIALVTTVVFAVAVGAYVAAYGCRAVRSECFPPPRSWIMEGRPVYTGSKAKRLGWAQIILGIVMTSVACGTAYSTWALLP